MKNPLAILMFAALSVSVSVSSGQTPVRVTPVQSKSIQQRQAVTGTLRAVARGEIAALEAGRLVELNAREGESVTKGDVIARVDDRRLRAERAHALAEKRVAEAELQRHQASARRAKADLARGEKLIRQNALSRQELDQYQAANEIAIAEIEAAKRRIERASETIRLLDVRLSDTTIVAPYDGSVVVRHVEPGDWVQAGEALLTLVSTGPIEAWLEIPERFAGSISIAPSTIVVRARFLDEDLRIVRVRRLADVNPRVRTMSLIATVDNQDGILSPGMSVEAYVQSGKIEDHLVTSKDAVIRRGGQPTVFVVDDDGTARSIPVRVLFETANQVAIEAPSLVSGSQVIVEGNERLMSGQVVTIVSERSPAQIASR